MQTSTKTTVEKIYNQEKVLVFLFKWFFHTQSQVHVSYLQLIKSTLSFNLSYLFFYDFDVGNWLKRIRYSLKNQQNMQLLQHCLSFV